MGSHEKKMHLVDMSTLSIPFKAKSGVSHLIQRQDKTKKAESAFYADNHNKI